MKDKEIMKDMQKTKEITKEEYTKIILYLIQTHYEKNESKFRDMCIKLILHYNSIKENDIADCITMYMYPDNPHIWGTNDVATEADRIKNEIQLLLSQVKDKLELLNALVDNKEKTKEFLNNILQEVFNEN